MPKPRHKTTDRVHNIPCPKCSSTNIELRVHPVYDDHALFAKCKQCGFTEMDSLIGSTATCRCPNCLSDKVTSKTISAQAGNTDWEVFHCSACGCESELLDDQDYESACDWYDPSRYEWLRRISADLAAASRRAPKPGSGTF